MQSPYCSQPHVMDPFDFNVMVILIFSVLRCFMLQVQSVPVFSMQIVTYKN